nr:phosphotransferase [Micromonospora sp. DSM 115978]
MNPTQHVAGGRLSSDTLDAIVAEVGAMTGFDTRGAELIKFTNNAVFRLPQAGVVLRIAGSTTARSRVGKVIQVARWLADHGVPAVRLMPAIPQPLSVFGFLATAWIEVPRVGRPPTGHDLGRILRRIHELPPPTFSLPSWNPMSGIRQRLAEPEGVEADDINFLRDTCDELEDLLTGIRPVLPSGPIHGDGFPGNLIAGPAGVVICDFDSASSGPREWDLVPVAVGRLRFDYPENRHEELVHTYGFDVTRWAGFSVFRQIRELQLVSSVVPILQSNPRVREQWSHRLISFRRGDIDSRWTTYR